ncbi:39S ribosomal protein L48, mitochondrial [Cimex lectularius]|uniref:Small ribosomal subunit protein uS10 domain-containing protein n=1 Tax=Cimex lectularius TaxID=79782 RepID=A0A8I6RQ64_CIMLE|nr:39S ribosomal protein L48, mitochondrial [Cimex lectularius]
MSCAKRIQSMFKPFHLRKACRTLQLLRHNHARSLCYSIHDPPYLDSLKPKIPQYNPVNIQIKGYDYALVESYQKLANKIASSLDLNISDAWATPATKAKIQKFKPNGTVIDKEYILTTYERNIQIEELSSTVAPILIELLQCALPQGISFHLHLHEEEDDVKRYVPDMELSELKTQLEELGGPVKKK